MQPIERSQSYKDCLYACRHDNYISTPEAMIAFGVVAICTLVATSILLAKGFHHRKRAKALENRLLFTVQDLGSSDNHKKKALKSIGWSCFCSLFTVLSATMVAFGAVTYINCKGACHDNY